MSIEGESEEVWLLLVQQHIAKNRYFCSHLPIKSSTTPETISDDVTSELRLAHDGSETQLESGIAV